MSCLCVEKQRKPDLRSLRHPDTSLVFLAVTPGNAINYFNKVPNALAWGLSASKFMAVAYPVELWLTPSTVKT